MENCTKSQIHPRTTNGPFLVSSSSHALLHKNPHVDVICHVLHWGNKEITLFLFFYVHILNTIFTDVIIFHLVKVCISKYIQYFSNYKTRIWEENGGASYSPNVAYLACWGKRGWRWSRGFFCPIFLL